MQATEQPPVQVVRGESTTTIYRFWHHIARKHSHYTMLRLTEICKEDDNPTGHSPSFLRLTSMCTTNSR